MRNRIGNLIKHKLKERRGISLTELLVTIIFCLLTFGLVVTAMQASVRQLKRQTMYAESKLLCSTLAMSVEDVLRYAGSGNKLLADKDAVDTAMSAGRDTGASLESIEFYSRTRSEKSDHSYFRITTEDDNTINVDGSKQDNSGHIVLMGLKSAASGTETLTYELVPARSYTQGMKADLKLEWHTGDTTKPEYHTFTGTVYVTDKDGNDLCSQDFTVRPINVNDSISS